MTANSNATAAWDINASLDKSGASTAQEDHADLPDLGMVPGTGALDGKFLLLPEEQYELEQFYYAEAALLDAQRFTQWAELFTDDCVYWMPIRQTRLTGQLDAEFTDRSNMEMAFYDDDKSVLRLRAHKLESAYAWGENPPSRTRRSFTNIRALSRDGDELSTSLNFTFFRGSYDREEDWWVGKRDDVLRRVDGRWQIARRSIFLDQTVILSRNLSHMF
ncbi:aromatic-ring-hydroxylating dioxygenase subunit beta [Nocardioides sp. NPDC006303]|uniref:aromatic-ring-hydroxylating dioxygenase subunit beta n=1 Tax=Nocardioides sp. NPDC006303 TaxID=3156747 RepID=UPI0033ABF475